MTANSPRFGIAPLAIALVGFALAVALLAIQRTTSERYDKRMTSIAVAREVINRGGAQGGAPRRRQLLQALAANGDSLSELDLRDAKLAQIELPGAVLDFSQLSGADLRAARLPLASLVGADAHDLDATGANAVGVDFTGAKLTRAKFESAALNRADFTAADLASANLQRAKLEQSRFVRSQLSGADLRAANLSGSVFFESDLSRVDLRGATLDGTRFDSVTLAGAHLGRSDLRAVSELSPQQLGSACLDPAHTQLPDGVRFDLRGYRARAICCELWAEEFSQDAAGQCRARTADAEASEQGVR